MVATLSSRRRGTRTRTRRQPLTWRDFKKDKLVPAFKELREGGIFTRTTHIACCGTCTHAELGAIVYDSDGDGQWDGYVGYHAQSVPMDAEDWLKPFGSIYLQHSLPEDDPGVIAFVREAFVKRGLAVEWNGEPTETILVRLPTPTGPLWDKLRAHVKQRSIFFYWHGLTHHLHADGGSESDLRQRSNIRYDPSAPGASPAGVTDLFNGLSFCRGMQFKAPPDYKIKTLQEEGKYRLMEDDEGLFDDDLGSKENIENYWNHGDLESLELDPPTHFDDDLSKQADEGVDVSPFVELKGAELDAIAFNGPVLSLASYATMGGKFTDVKTYDAPSGNCFTVAELHAILEEHFGWLARVEQFQNKLNLDHVFFEGLYARDDGALEVHWGS